VFPDVNVHSGFAAIPLSALAMHRAGLEHHPSSADRAAVASLGDGRTQRAALAARILSRAPDHEPGTFSYSNVGYILLGAAIERVSGRPFEDVMTQEIFMPLGMTSCGFLPPVPAEFPGGVPVGHHPDGAPVPVGMESRHLPIDAVPAGLIHCNLPDWLRFVEEHVAGEQGHGKLLSPEMYTRLHKPDPTSGYAFGWGVARSRSTGERALSHSGGDGVWQSMLFVRPDGRRASLLATNIGDDNEAPLLKLLLAIDDGRCSH
jgi:CubicO group peptidase (beta-lactamase class C family)